MTFDPMQSIIIKPEVSMMSSQNPQTIETPTNYYVLASPLQTPKKCISCPSIPSDVQVSPIQHQSSFPASNIGPITPNAVRVSKIVDLNLMGGRVRYGK